MSNIVYLPVSNELGHVFNQIAPDVKNRDKIFTELAKRVLEHSDEIRKLIDEAGGDIFNE